MFTDQNTEGFTEDEISTLNAAFFSIQRANPGVDESNIADLITNSWCPGMTAEALFWQAGAQLRRPK